MRRITFLFFLLPIVFFLLGCQTEPLKIAVVTGGHDYDSLNFVEVFNSYEDIQFDMLVQPAMNEIYGTDSIENYDVLVFYDMYQDISEAQQTAFINVLKSGIGVIFMHHSIASYQDWDEYIRILGAKYHQEPYMRGNDSIPASVYFHGEDVIASVVDKNHPVTEGLNEFEIHEETYDQVEMLSGIHPLIKTDHPESMDYLVWTNNYEDSKIVYIQFGHDNHAYSNQNFRTLLRNAIEWTAGR